MHFRPTVRGSFLVAALFLALSCGGDGGSTGPTPNPAPVLTAIARDTATAGADPFSVVLGGSGFMSGAVGLFDGAPRTTAFHSTGSVSFQLQPADLASVGSHEIRVKNPEPGGGPSEVILFHVLTPPPVPVLDSLSPDTIFANTLGTLTLKAFGHGFVPGAVLKMDGTAVATARISDTLLQTTIVGGILGTPGAVTFSVFKQGPGGGTSGGRAFVIVSAPPGPVVIGISPDSVQVGPDTISVSIRGTSFTGATQVDFNNQGNDRSVTPSQITDTSLVAALDRTWLSGAGQLGVRVHAATGTSAFFFAETYNAVVVLDSLAPDTLDATQAVDTLIVYGSGFSPGLTFMNPASLPTTSQVIDFYHARLIVPKGTMLNGTFTFGIWDDNQSQWLDTLRAIVRLPVPVVDSITVQPNFGSDTVGSSGMAFIAWGHDLALNGTAVVDGVEIAASHPATTFSGFIVDSSFMTVPDTLMLAYKNPSPGGGTSAAFPFIVRSPNAPPTVDSVTPAAARSDSGVQVITVHGHGFIPGSVVGPQPYGPDSTWLLQTTFPAQVLNDSTLTFTYPAAYLHAGITITFQVQSPLPTARPSEPFRIPVWTTGVRTVSTLTNGPIRGWTADTLRGRVYATRQSTLLALDPTTGAITDSLALPGLGGSMILSAEAELLYVKLDGGNRLSRVDLGVWTVSRTIDFGTWSDITGNYLILASTVIPSTSDPTTITVVRGRQFYPYEWPVWNSEIVVIDDSIARPAVSTQLSEVLTGAASGDTITLVTAQHLIRVRLDSAGIVRIDSLPHDVISAAVILSPTRLFGDGRLIDLTTGATVASGPDLGGVGLRSPVAGRFFTARNVETSPGAITTRLEFAVIDLASGTFIRRIGFGGPTLGIGLVTPSGRLFASGGPSYAGGDPPLAWVNVNSVLTDP